ncbi:MAG TPA: glutamine--fructose-6-phosphate transaminase (isomerizing) [Solirubrobacteraceae bacterium]|jgi:glucosamine--fructose-6-phosphate aminotransferase (isomerizing)
MCGIIGYVGHRRSQEVLYAGLKRLEYRGYDSAGLAWHDNDRTECVRSVGNLDALHVALAAHDPQFGAEETPVIVATRSIGIGHTRWATHGGVTENNAHPHVDATGRIRIVLNGIIENYLELRGLLAEELIECASDTDAEIVAHLISRYYEGDLATAVRRATSMLSGHYAIVAMCDEEPDTLVGVRRECPLVLGLGDGEQFIASAIPAFLEHTRQVTILQDGEIAVLRADEVTILDAYGLPHTPQPTEVDWDDDHADKQGYETFMLKEIHEQPRAIADTIAHCRMLLCAEGADGLTERLRAASRIMIIGCGSSYHAGLAGRMAIERWARVPVEIDVASEFRYREPIIEPGSIVIGITQSGETADTLAAMRLARAQGATVVALTNAPGSQATRDSDAVLLTRAGTEMGVAATKTFVTQVVALQALALRIAELRGALSQAEVAELDAELDLLPERAEAVIGTADCTVRELAGRLASSPFFLYLGRLSGVPVAMEGALKLKEVSYVPTDAYAAGEMKHGPIALLSPEARVVCVATDHKVLPKLLSNLSEVRARGARVLAIATEGCKEIAEHAEEIVYVPRTDPQLQVVLATIPLQLFAYHVARARALNVDQPRNLAKTVTVE